MQLGEIIATYDVAMALRGETGKFDVTSPAGEIYHVTCKADHSIASLEWSGNGTEPQPFLIRKVAEPVSPEIGKEQAKSANAKTPESESSSRVVRTPFLIENRSDETKAVGEDKLEAQEIADFDLVYLECDPKTGRPSSCIYLKNGTSGESEQLMTPACATFIEFDAEVRRLHARLDEIRSRAKKEFYKTHASAASA